MKKLKKTLVGACWCLLLALPVAVLLFPYRPSSGLEEEQLAPKPEITVEGCLDGSYFSGVSAYLSDHLPLREFWLRLQTKVTLALQKKEINNVHVLEDRLIRHLDSPRSGVTEAAVAAVKNFSEAFDGKTFFMLIPSAEEIHASMLPPVQAFSQQQLIQTVYDALAGYGVGGVDVYSALAAISDRYLYCRTDSRWTTLGAYCGYNAIARTMGFTPVSLEKMNIEHVSHDYHGSLYWETGVTDISPDTIDLYTYSGRIPRLRLTLYSPFGRSSYDSLYFREYLATEDGYSVFLGEDCLMATVETEYTTGEKLLIFGDSLCDNLLPFLSLHYSRITLVDLSAAGFHYKDYLDLAEYDSVLFCYGMESFLQGGVISKVNQPASGEEAAYYPE